MANSTPDAGSLEAQSVTLAWGESTHLPLLFADHLSLLQLNGTMFLVFGQTQSPTNLKDGAVPGAISITPVARLAVPFPVAKRIAHILSRVALSAGAPGEAEGTE